MHCRLRNLDSVSSDYLNRVAVYVVECHKMAESVFQSMLLKIGIRCKPDGLFISFCGLGSLPGIWRLPASGTVAYGV